MNSINLVKMHFLNLRLQIKHVSCFLDNKTTSDVMGNLATMLISFFNSIYPENLQIPHNVKAALAVLKIFKRALLFTEMRCCHISVTGIVVILKIFGILRNLAQIIHCYTKKLDTPFKAKNCF